MPVRTPGRSCGCWWEISSTIDSAVVPAKLFWAVSGRQPDRSTGVPLATAALTIESREVDVEGVSDASGPDPSTVGRGRFAGPAFQEEFASSGVLAGAVAGEGMEPQCLPSVRVGLAEGDPVRQVLVFGPSGVDLDLVTSLWVKTRLGPASGDIGIDIHN